MSEHQHGAGPAAQTPLAGSGERWLILVLDGRLRHAVLPADPGPAIVLEGRRYSDVAGEGFNWFADRLFDASGRCAGFELSPLVPVLENVPASIARLPYVTVLRDGVPVDPRNGEGAPAGDAVVQIRIFFGDGPVADAEVRGDQAFLGRVLADEGENFALAFSTMNFLDPADLASLSGRGIPTVATG